MQSMRCMPPLPCWGPWFAFGCCEAVVPLGLGYSYRFPWVFPWLERALHHSRSPYAFFIKPWDFPQFGVENILKHFPGEAPGCGGHALGCLGGHRAARLSPEPWPSPAFLPSRGGSPNGSVLWVGPGVSTGAAEPKVTYGFVVGKLGCGENSWAWWNLKFGDAGEADDVTTTHGYLPSEIFFKMMRVPKRCNLCTTLLFNFAIFLPNLDLAFSAFSDAGCHGHLGTAHWYRLGGANWSSEPLESLLPPTRMLPRAW